MTSKSQSPLNFKLLAKCSVTKARVGVVTLLHSEVSTPVFMPVGTKVSIREATLIPRSCSFLIFFYFTTGVNERYPPAAAVCSQLRNYAQQHISLGLEAGKSENLKFLGIEFIFEHGFLGN